MNRAIECFFELFVCVCVKKLMFVTVNAFLKNVWIVFNVITNNTRVYKNYKQTIYYRIRKLDYNVFTMSDN